MAHRNPLTTDGKEVPAPSYTASASPYHLVMAAKIDRDVEEKKYAQELVRTIASFKAAIGSHERTQGPEVARQLTTLCRTLLSDQHQEKNYQLDPKALASYDSETCKKINALNEAFSKYAEVNLIAAQAILREHGGERNAACIKLYDRGMITYKANELDLPGYVLAQAKGQLKCDDLDFFPFYSLGNGGCAIPDDACIGMHHNQGHSTLFIFSASFSSVQNAYLSKWANLEKPPAILRQLNEAIQRDTHYTYPDHLAPIASAFRLNAKQILLEVVKIVRSVVDERSSKVSESQKRNHQDELKNIQNAINLKLNEKKSQLSRMLADSFTWRSEKRFIEILVERIYRRQLQQLAQEYERKAITEYSPEVIHGNQFLQVFLELIGSARLSTDPVLSYTSTAEISCTIPQLKNKTLPNDIKQLLDNLKEVEQVFAAPAEKFSDMYSSSNAYDRFTSHHFQDTESYPIRIKNGAPRLRMSAVELYGEMIHTKRDQIRILKMNTAELVEELIRQQQNKRLDRLASINALEKFTFNGDKKIGDTLRKMLDSSSSKKSPRNMDLKEKIGFVQEPLVVVQTLSQCGDLAQAISILNSLPVGDVTLAREHLHTGIASIGRTVTQNERKDDDQNIDNALIIAKKAREIHQLNNHLNQINMLEKHNIIPDDRIRELKTHIFEHINILRRQANDPHYKLSKTEEEKIELCKKDCKQIEDTMEKAKTVITVQEAPAKPAAPDCVIS